jgi:hypothetical protein
MSLRKGFLETEYAVWQAKFDILEKCQLGDVVILGDSKASAAFMTTRLPMPATNLALSGTTPVEAAFEARRIFKCGKLPKLVVLSFDPYQFAPGNFVRWFWSRSARFNLFRYADLEEIRAQEEKLSPGLLYRSEYGAEPPGFIKNLMYIYHFPPYDVGNLIGGRLIGRLESNNQAYDETIRQAGGHIIDSNQKCAKNAYFESAGRFYADPLITHYFDQLIRDLKSRMIEVKIIQAPISEISAASINSQFAATFQEFLNEHSNEAYAVPDVGLLFPVADDCDFSDDFHLNKAGAEKFSDVFVRQALN